MRSKKGRRAARSAVAVAIWACGASTLAGCPYSDPCWEVEACAPDPEPPPGPCEGAPETAPALDECGVFVSEGGDDDNPGTKGAPVRTLQHAIGLAARGRGNGEAPTRRVYACGGAFEEAIALPSGVDLWGGRLCAGGEWSYGGPLDGQNALTVIAPPVGIPVRVLGGDDAVIAGDDAVSVIFGVRAVAADASASDGKSSIAMILEHGARAIVQSSVILAGDGKDGEPGEDAPSFRASSGVVGNNGADACTADVAPGAHPVVTVCGDGIESTGGQGGDGGLEAGRDGASGLPEPAGNPPNLGRGGSGAVSMPCKPGENGAVGADAERAAGAVGAGRLGLDGWVGVRGKDGEKGGVGQGGGGGGGGKGRDPTRNACPTGRPHAGAAGGSGGSGGCGGKGGQGGGYGGASIAIVALQGSDLTVAASTVLGSKGGDGGVGGTGQWGGFGVAGGLGGNGFLTDTSPGCRGGFGGDGGRGGDAGGGLGGHSLGIGSVGASVAILQDATVSPGHAGNGGLGANASPESKLGQGEGGIALFWYRFDAPATEPPR
ncbi:MULTISPECIES: hypothetical protein [Sorangium]|uniref:PGRS family protein n=1 Tax=Sorangium cellulosum TaxID=56 RepID=A0A4P2QZP8_SORCE|nr:MULTISPECIES: hypothetical protein [Sorangium]AUX36099.1 hypothetical protein SOCE836_083050 [Sorangium cellulosum]WCQ95403.1 hypothetical protein NQZ70_08179 [Sorangium sp. Soce836]